MRQVYVGLLLILGLIGCEDIVTDVDLPKEESRVVVSSFITPTDSLVSVYLLESSPLFSDVEDDYDGYYGDEKLIKDARVFIAKQHAAFVALNYNEERGKYVIDTELFPIEYGQTYMLKVITKDGHEVSATTTIPTNYFPNLEIEVDKIDSQYDNDLYNVSVWWLDEKSIDNYYRVSYESCDELNCYGAHVAGDKLRLLLSDEGKDGGKVGVSKCELYQYIPSGGIDANDSANVVITKLDKTYFDFLRYTYTYEENPFSEPRTAVTNIKGGLGVFVGYTTFKQKLMLE